MVWVWRRFRTDFQGSWRRLLYIFSLWQKRKWIRILIDLFSLSSAQIRSDASSKQKLSDLPSGMFLPIKENTYDKFITPRLPYMHPSCYASAVCSWVRILGNRIHLLFIMCRDRTAKTNCYKPPGPVVKHKDWELWERPSGWNVVTTWWTMNVIGRCERDLRVSNISGLGHLCVRC